LQVQEHLKKQVLISQATSKELNKTEAANNDLKKQLEVKEEVLKNINEKQTEMHNTINGLTKTVDKMNHQLFEKQTQLQTNIDGLTKRVESLSEMSQFLCELPKDVSTCKIRAFTVSRLKHIRQSATSNLGQTSTFRRTILPPSSGSHLYSGLEPLVYIQKVVLAICTG
jgi:chromosome segregation ATPase